MMRGQFASAQRIEHYRPVMTILARMLGVERGIVLHVDDLGMCHSGNLAFTELHRRGFVTCGSVMVPCPWFREIADLASRDPSLDLGVHLTLTSEWRHYRWSPISTTSAASGLIDADGYFWRDVGSLRHHLVPEAAEIELRAQIDRARSAGLRPTHLDAHMAAAMLPELLACHVVLARELGVVPVLPRKIRFAPDQPSYERTIATLEAAGLPLPDACRGTLAVDPQDTRGRYRELIESLSRGITHMALHCAQPGDMQAINPQHAKWRVAEYELLADGAVHRWCEELGVVPIGYRAIQRFWPRAVGSGPGTDPGPSELSAFLRTAPSEQN